MATFTVELRDIVGKYDLGMRDYPIFSPSYREILNKTIVDNFWFHEIGFETVEMFVHQLNTRLRLIMPAMNKIYDSTLYDIDPLLTMSIRTVSARENEGVSTMSRRDDSSSDSTSNSTSNSTSRAVNSQFPQSMLSDNGDYATSAVDSTSKTDNDSTGTTTGVNDTKTDEKESVKGNSDTLMSGFTGSQGELLMRYRDSIINVDMMVIDSLKDLFMSIVAIPDSYTPRPSWASPYAFPYPIMGVRGMGFYY